MSMMGMVMGMALMFESMNFDFEERGKEKCEQLRKEYANLQNLPRKKKKREKKRIILEYQIFSWNPLTHTEIKGL